MSRTVGLDVVNNLRIASPCSMKWDEMTGDDKRRLCKSCGLHVHNFEAMTTEEVADLVGGADGGVCGRLYRRADGTVLTADCPVGLRAARVKMARFAGRVAAAASFVLTGSLLWAARQRDPWDMARARSLEPYAAMSRWLSGAPLPSGTTVTMGFVCTPPPTTPNPPAPTPGQ